MGILSRICKELMSTNSKKEKIRILESYLSNMTPEEREVLIILLLSRIDGYTPKVVMDAIGDFSSFYHGDVYEAVMAYLSTLHYRQRSLTGESLDIVTIVNSLLTASRDNRKIALKSIVSSLEPEDAAFLISSLLGDLRVGVKEGTILEALARLCGRSYGEIKEIASLTNLRDMVRCKFSQVLEPLKPFSPMLAEKALSFQEIIARGNIWAEPKLDGVRILVHKKDGKVRIYSRRGRDITPQFPEIVEYASLLSGDFILDGEVIAKEKGSVAPFQSIMRRFAERRNVSIDFFFFDIPYYGRVLVQESYEKRREILESLTEKYVERKKVRSEDELIQYFQEVIARGFEGLVCKNPHGRYRIGTRSREWMKIKRKFEVDAVIVAAEWGHGRRRKWLSDYHLALWKDDELVEVGKTFKGLSDEEMENLTKVLLSLKIKDIPGGIAVKPKIVVEVEFEDVQLSPKYERYALRFARIKRIREDKDVEEAGKMEEIERIYKKLHSESGYS